MTFGGAPKFGGGKKMLKIRLTISRQYHGKSLININLRDHHNRVPSVHTFLFELYFLVWFLSTKFQSTTQYFNAFEIKIKFCFLNFIGPMSPLYLFVPFLTFPLSSVFFDFVGRYLIAPGLFF